ncbi:hypothetical protein PAHAL_1G035000 [Panicum hallii]|uniref:Uncharacterized protein n=1 Tax=Panicum hallii TaxID=206008 RepID=A0A2T8KTU1_9POAL|nr:hypothetical protein PAHAL_1G035000 [Panicum hallii]
MLACKMPSIFLKAKNRANKNVCTRVRCCCFFSSLPSICIIVWPLQPLLAPKLS